MMMCKKGRKYTTQRCEVRDVVGDWIMHDDMMATDELRWTSALWWDDGSDRPETTFAIVEDY